MKFKAIKQDLNQRLKIVSRISGSQQDPLPSLKYMLVVADKKTNQVTFTGTNVEMSVVVSLKTEVIKSGQAIILADLLAKYVDRLPDGWVSVSNNGKKTDINWSTKTKTTNQNQHYKAEITNSSNNNDFPVITQIATTTTNKLYQLKKTDIKSGLDRVLFATAKETSHGFLTGVYIYNQKTDILMVGTDSFRLSEVRIGQTKTKTSRKTLIPAKALTQYNSILPHCSDQITIYEDAGQVLLESGWIKFISNKTSGEYPPYIELIPKPEEFQTVAEVDLSKLQEAVNLTAVFSLRNPSSSITLDFQKPKSAKTSSILISTTAKNLGGTDGSMIPTKITGPTQKVSFNANYLQQALESLKPTQKIKFNIKGVLDPCLITPVTKTANYRHVLMPVK